MKTKLYILGFIILFITGCSNDFIFNIDINKLTYSLPEHTVVCLPEKKQLCNTEGCKRVKPTVFIVYNENRNLIYRCDNNPCDEYEVKSVKSGLFTNIEPIQPRGFSVKLSNDGSYIETVTLGLDTFISQGKCK